MAEAYDVAVIGGGPGGYVAAIRAAQLGLKTVVIEREHLGGICLNWGCIPTKALLRTAEVLRLAQHGAEFGIKAEGLSFDLGKIVARSRAVANKLASGVAYLLKKHKVTVIDGTARLKAKGVVAVAGKDGKPLADVEAKHIIIATGARARVLPGLEPDGKLVWTYKEAMVPPSLPKSLLVVGSGAIGIEFASFYNALGVKVTVVEIVDKILPFEDDEISALARKSFEKQGMTIHTGAKVDMLEKGKDSVKATLALKDGKTQIAEFDRVIVAAGIVGNVENIRLEELGIKTDRTHIVVDEFSRTSAAGVYAIGDVAGPPWLAHKASHEGIICVEKIAGRNPHPLNVRNIPGCTYSHPQVASIGITEAMAKKDGREIKVGRFPYQGNGKAIALGEPEGLVKTIFDAKTGELLGAHMVGAEVTELIQGFGVAKTLETTEAELMETVFPHPTLSETMLESVFDAYGRVIHI
ncbi:dihydrolipoamide dehydrogenase [Rhodomicrobium udaipurense JA643]|uniref:Dihydrolipoyl dehydrogenase n=1 Tax=Rhodomicrobium udaipurense TaxID=1202716 RepID=A0A8I1GEP1_9HYPH|nr:dihydrolipoyl dehydrogenase [Rhodomicrobium udaipurense]KAI94826.1 dihydrolipoamide dehydrogenase [Rhodomicrobium udaipurense JA643]MBJ7544620.1 dihydrolipoyl dehydrogenase [Rhodomicrobium udaipurense]